MKIQEETKRSEELQLLAFLLRCVRETSANPRYLLLIDDLRGKWRIPRSLRGRLKTIPKNYRSAVKIIY